MTPNEQKAYAEPKDKRTQQQIHFDEVYDVFYKFYSEKLAGDLPAHERVRLMLTTRFFDDLELQARLNKTSFGKFPSTVNDKQAVASVAYMDALMIHNRTAGLKFETVDNAEIAKGKGNY